MRFIAEHADRTDGGLRWGVESICAVLSEHAFVQNLHRGHYELATDAAAPLRLATAFTHPARTV